MIPTTMEVTEAAWDALGPSVDVSYNEEAGMFVVSEWHSDDAPFYMLPEASALKFLHWLGRERRAHIKAARREVKRLTTHKERKRMKAAFKSWELENPEDAS